MSPPRVAIIGAGPTGCTLGRLLYLNNIPFTVFEGEVSASIRSQGSTLDLHPPALEALQHCRLYEKFRKYARYDGEAEVIADKHYNVLVKQAGNTEEKSQGRPEIDRPQLRRILFESLPADAIVWSHRLRSVDDDGSLHFDHGVKKGFDLIVGADGAWSRVRAKLTDVKPFYSGLGGISLTISDPENRFSDLYKQVNRGSLFCFSGGKGLQPQQLGEGSIHMYTWSRRQENWMATCGFDPWDSTAARKHPAEIFADWHPQLRKFTQVANENSLEPRNLYMLPMTPFAGEGVNLAIVDALRLAQAVVARNGASLDERVKQFEKEMFDRTAPVQRETKRNLDGLFSEDRRKFEQTILDLMAEAPQEIPA
ncbi:MAG: hypothetical protein MMC23_006158 [Stictis urceolatum]|nr:hypothetical protein [Stictis urceolata]